MRIILNIIRTIFIFFFAFLIFFEGVMYFQTKFLKKDFPNILGYAVLVVKTGSMEPIIKTGSSILVKVSDGYYVGDIVVYSEGNSYVTHEIISIDGYKYETKGKANNKSEIITRDKIKAKVINNQDWFSNLMTNIRNPIILITLGVLGLIIPEILLNIFKKTEKVVVKK